MEFMTCSECNRRMNPVEVSRYGNAPFRKCDDCRTIGRHASMFRLDNLMRHVLFDERLRRPKKGGDKREFLRQTVTTLPHDQVMRAILQRANTNWIAQAILYGWGENMPPITSIQNGDVTYSQGNRRVTQRISRYARRFIHPKLQETITDRDVELFYIDMKEQSHVPVYTYETVRGEDIRFWYNTDNYGNGDIGTLRHSCMQYHECQPYLDIYVHNPEQCQMLIAKDEETNKIYGRCIVWLGTDNVWYMDRAYGSELLCRLMYNYGEQQGFQRMRYGNDNNVTIQLSQWLFAQYPHVDTMYTLDAQRGILTQRANGGAFYLQLHGVNGAPYPFGAAWRRCNDCRHNTVMRLVDDPDTYFCTRCGTAEQKEQAYAHAVR